MKKPPPRVIHVRVGNVNMKRFFQIILLHWPSVVELVKNHKLVNVFVDRIEGID